MRLKEDSSSWRSDGIKRRDFRRDPGLPEGEIPRKTHTKGKNKKHIHKYVRKIIGQEVVYSWRHFSRQPVLRDKILFVCEGCGHKRHY